MKISKYLQAKNITACFCFSKCSFPHAVSTKPQITPQIRHFFISMQLFHCLQEETCFIGSTILKSNPINLAFDKDISRVAFYYFKADSSRPNPLPDFFVVKNGSPNLLIALAASRFLCGYGDISTLSSLTQVMTFMTPPSGMASMPFLMKFNMTCFKRFSYIVRGFFRKNNPKPVILFLLSSIKLRQR